MPWYPQGTCSWVMLPGRRLSLSLVHSQLQLEVPNKRWIISRNWSFRPSIETHHNALFFLWHGHYLQHFVGIIHCVASSQQTNIKSKPAFSTVRKLARVLASCERVQLTIAPRQSSLTIGEQSTRGDFLDSASACRLEASPSPGRKYFLKDHFCSWRES